MIERRLMIKSCGLVCLAFAITAPARASQPPAAVPDDNTKNRYISFQPNNASDLVAFEVALPDGRIGWVGEPILKNDRGVDPQWIALVEESATGDGSDQMRDWRVYTQPDSEDIVIHVTGCVIIPGQTYPIRSRDSQGLFSASAAFLTTPIPSIGSWADAVGGPDNETGQWTGPNATVNYLDISAVFLGVEGREIAPVTWLDLASATPDYRINYSDLSAVSNGWASVPYFDSQPCCNSIADCPLGDVPPPPGFAGGAIAFVPVGATGGAPTIVGNEIRIAGGGVVVTVELRVSNWDANLNGSPRLETVQATIDSLSFLGGNATPPNPGADLVPVGWPDEPHLGAYQIHEHCFGGTLDGEPCGSANSSPLITVTECQAAGGFFCDRNDDLVLAAFPLGGATTFSLNFEWGVTAGPPERYEPTSGVDDGASRHLGELRVTVPVSAAGTYTIGFDTAANATFMEAVRSVPITELTLTPAFITVGSAPAADCQPNGVPDHIDIANGTSANCNLNGTPDECDIADGTSLDCNGNGTPDECDVADGTSEDCNGNQVPDECDDCNANGIADVDDIAAATSTDCDGNCVPDECDPDCNDNGITDVCDIADGTSTDSNADNVPDECFSAVTAPSGTAGATKNRYLSFVSNNGLAVAAIAVDLPDGRQGWVGEPVLKDDRGVDAQLIALVVDAPVFRVWPEDVVYVTGCVVIPDQEYELRAMIAPATFSDPLVVATTPAPTTSGSWADTVGDFDGQTGTWGPPDGVTSFQDIAAEIGGFQHLGAAPATWFDLSPQWPNYTINFSDIGAVVKGFQSLPYFDSLAGFPSLADCPLGDQP